MPATLTPLRYPGGKTKLYDYVVDIFEANNICDCTYIEPFAGGAGLAIKLLQNQKVSNIILNDLDPLIYAFWYCVLNHPIEFCSRIDSIPVTVEEWNKQRYITLNYHDFSLFEVGLAAFYMNRTNVSGVISGGMIGGKDQTGKYKLDARFNKAPLIKKIKNIEALSSKIQIFNKDVKDFIREDVAILEDKNIFVNYDPPYVKKGSLLYRNSFTEEDHCELSDLICSSPGKWIVTYDKCSLIHNLYNEYKQEIITLNYSTGSTKQGYEIVIYSDQLEIPKLAYCQVSEK